MRDRRFRVEGNGSSRFPIAAVGLAGQWRDTEGQEQGKT